MRIIIKSILIVALLYAVASPVFADYVTSKYLGIANGVNVTMMRPDSTTVATVAGMFQFDRISAVGNASSDDCRSLLRVLR